LIVVDASVLTDFLLGRDAAVEAVVAALGDAQEFLHAPELIEPETLNALRRLMLAGHLAEDRATEAAADLGDVRMLRYSHAALRERIWDLRHQLTAYDATYLALAEALGAQLLTADRGLAERARDALGEDAVRLVA
jgi:predicted nucleic acid-binding protein